MPPKALGFSESSSDEDEIQLPKGSKSTRAHRLVSRPPISLRSNKPLQQLDSSVYEYDEHYDDIQESRNANLRALGGARSTSGARYMNDILEAKKRRDEDKLRVEQLKIQKEREMEGDLFKEKEVFVTSQYRAYKVKMNLEDDGQTLANEQLKEYKPDESREDATTKELKRIEEKLTESEAIDTESKLLPPLSQAQIDAAKERYFLRSAIST